MFLVEYVLRKNSKIFESGIQLCFCSDSPDAFNSHQALKVFWIVEILSSLLKLVYSRNDKIFTMFFS